MILVPPLVLGRGTTQGVLGVLLRNFPKTSQVSRASRCAPYTLGPLKNSAKHFMQCSPTWHVLSSSPVTRASQTPNGTIFSVEHPGTSEEYWWKSKSAVSLRMIDLTGGSLTHDQSGDVMETSRPNKITLGSHPRRSFSKGINTIKHALETHVLRPPTPPRGCPSNFQCQPPDTSLRTSI